MKNNFKKIFCNDSGSAMVMVIMASIGVTALMYFSLTASKLTSQIATKNTADKQLEAAMQMIGALILSPASCNANFLGVSATTPGSLAQIYRCTSGNCRTAPINRTIALYIDKFDIYGGSSREVGKVKLVSANYAIVSAQTSGASTRKPAILRLTLTFKKDIGKTGGATKDATAQTTRTYTLETPVVTQTFSGPPAFTLSPATPVSILGCAANPQTTLVY